MSTLKYAVLAVTVLFFAGQKSKPVVYIIGDSTVKNGTGNGSNSQWGWGSLFSLYADTNFVSIQNHAIGGRSSRTFINEGRWEKIRTQLKAGDYVILQFGHNDSGPLADTARARGSLKGMGTDSTVIYNPILKKQETVYSYGWYLRKYVKDTRDRGAIPMICSPVPRNIWKDDLVVGTDYQVWAKQVAAEMKCFYLPLNELISAAYQKHGADKVKLFFPGDHTHTNREGALFNAARVAEGIKAINGCSLGSWMLLP